MNKKQMVRVSVKYLEAKRDRIIELQKRLDAANDRIKAMKAFVKKS